MAEAQGWQLLAMLGKLPISVSLTPVKLGVRPKSLEFGEVAVRESVENTVTFKHLGSQGNAEIELSSIKVEGASAFDTDFQAPEILKPGKEKAVTVVFAPKDADEKKATLKAEYSGLDGSSEALEVSLSGKGTELSVTPKSLNFGEVRVDKSDEQKVVLKHSGSQNSTEFEVGPIEIEGDSAFHTNDLQGCSEGLGAGKEKIVKVTFSPSNAGKKEATLRIKHSESNDSLPVSLSGKGTRMFEVVGVSPKDGVWWVARETHIEAVFSKDVDRSTLNDRTFMLVEEGTNKRVSAGISYDLKTRRATLKPVTKLAWGTKYKVTVKAGKTGGVREDRVNGESIAQDKVWSFQTQKRRMMW